MSPIYDLPIQRFLDYLKFEKRYSQHTVEAYRIDLFQFKEYLQLRYESPALADIKPNYIKSWLVDIRQVDKSISTKTIRRKISTLKSFFKFMLHNGELEATPVWSVLSPKISKRLPRFIQENDTQRLFLATEFPDDWTGRTDRLMLATLYATGIRRNELIQLKLTHIDHGNRHIKVLGKGNKERLIPVSQALLQLIDEYIGYRDVIFPGNDQPYLFLGKKGKMLRPEYVYRHISKYLQPVSTIEKKSPHLLRHSFATHLMNNGADINAVKELLGHSSLAATQVYTHNSIDKLKEIYRQAHPKA